MDINEAKQILIENRPDRPQSTKNRRLQAAIDLIISELDRYQADEANRALQNIIDRYKDIDDNV